MRFRVTTVRFLAVGAAVAAIAALAAAWLLWGLLRVGPDREVAVAIAPGTPVARIVDELHRAELLPSPHAARLYLLVEGHGRAPRFGRYRFPPRQRPVDVLDRLLEGRVETVTVTVLEGSTAREAAARFSAAGIGSAAEWDELVTSADWVHDLAPEASSLEGFLFPDTYILAAGATAEQAGRLMVQRFRAVWAEEHAAVERPWAPPYQVVVLASLVEAETGLVDERGRIAGVFLNRLRRGMLLQCDPTVAFALKRRGEWSGQLLRVHWQVDDPYNTYRYPGLPPGPINCPGRGSIAAALAPEEHDLLYFVARPEGGHAFSATLEEHNRAVARLLRARR